MALAYLFLCIDLFYFFRNKSSKKVNSLVELKYYLKQQGEDETFLENIKFKNDRDHDIVSNKTGANKLAKLSAREWVEENTK